jgi:cytochrome c oxidase cbb3-type subunit I/II
MIRPMVAEYQRYGEAARAEEFIYDHPFQWGSKRTGPDLEREGGKYPSLWHYSHLLDPRSTSPGSNMPPYPWLATAHIDSKLAPRKLLAMQKLGVPYTNADIDGAEAAQHAQADTVVANLAENGVRAEWNSEVVALISYLQRLGRDQGVALAVAAPAPPPVASPEAVPVAPVGGVQ